MYSSSEDRGETTRLLPDRDRQAEFLSASMENIPRVHSFGCLSLKIGCIMSACLLILYAVLYLAQCTEPLTNMGWSELDPTQCKLYSVLSLAQCTAALTNVGWSELDPTQWKDTWSGLAVVLLLTATAIHIVTLFLTALMLVGALREKAHQMRPWVVWTSIQVTVYFLLFVFLIITSMVYQAGEKSFLFCLIDFLTLLIRFYMLMIVASHYRMLEDEYSDGERLKTLVHSEPYYNAA